MTGVDQMMNEMLAVSIISTAGKILFYLDNFKAQVFQCHNYTYRQWWALAKEILAALTLALITENFSGANTYANLQKF